MATVDSPPQQQQSFLALQAAEQSDIAEQDDISIASYASVGAHVALKLSLGDGDVIKLITLSSSFDEEGNEKLPSYKEVCEMIKRRFNHHQLPSSFVILVEDQETGDDSLLIELSTDEDIIELFRFNAISTNVKTPACLDAQLREVEMMKHEFEPVKNEEEEVAVVTVVAAVATTNEDGQKDKGKKVAV